MQSGQVSNVFNSNVLQAPPSVESTISASIKTNIDYTNSLEKAIARVRQTRTDLNNAIPGAPQHAIVAQELLSAYRDYLELTNSIYNGTNI
jgi:hypothetical protein